MPIKTTNENGEEIEAYTAEELEAQKQAAVEEYKQSNPTEAEEIEKLQNELQAKEEELTKFKEKDLNFGKLRESKEKLEIKIDDLKKSIDEKIGIAKKEVLEGVMEDHYNEVLKSLAGKDKELTDKIEFHYKRLSDAGTTKEEIGKKLNDAFLLATGGEKGKSTSGIFSSKGVSPLGTEKSKPVTDEEKEFTKKLGKAGGIEIKDEDFNK